MKHWLILFLLLSTHQCLYAFIDINAGKKIATRACFACHGKTGNSPNPLWPNLAGQHESYLIKQMLAFKSGARNNRLMVPIMATLSKDDIKNIARFYAKQKPVIGFASKKNIQRGTLLYRGGDVKKHISACIACHGPKGRGNADTEFPALRGQHAEYIIDELGDFKKGERTTDFNHIMRDIAHKLNKSDRKAVANYIQGLH